MLGTELPSHTSAPLAPLPAALGGHRCWSDPTLVPALPNCGCWAQAPVPVWHMAPELQVAQRKSTAPCQGKVTKHRPAMQEPQL